MHVVLHSARYFGKLISGLPELSAFQVLPGKFLSGLLLVSAQNALQNCGLSPCPESVPTPDTTVLLTSRGEGGVSPR